MTTENDLPICACRLSLAGGSGTRFTVLSSLPTVRDQRDRGQEYVSGDDTDEEAARCGRCGSSLSRGSRGTRRRHSVRLAHYSVVTRDTSAVSTSRGPSTID